jgi:hypothetical protein
LIFLPRATFFLIKAEFCAPLVLTVSLLILQNGPTCPFFFLVPSYYFCSEFGSRLDLFSTVTISFCFLHLIQLVNISVLTHGTLLSISNIFHIIHIIVTDNQMKIQIIKYNKKIRTNSIIILFSLLYRKFILHLTVV